jgi:protoporphyrinogen oxidase
MLKLDILGGGPAGLFAGYYAKKAGLPFTIYEASNRIGGNCKTFDHGEFRYDSGAHRFHDKDPEMTREVLQLLGDDMQEIFAPSFIYHRGKMIHFPITPTNMLSKLDSGTLFRAVYHLITDRFRIPEATNFLQYAHRKYGSTIADLFLTNYSEKLWGLSTDRLSTSIAGNRLKELNLKSIITEVLYPNRKAKHLEGAFFYPKQGYGRIADRVGEYCGHENIRHDSRITRVFHEGTRIGGFELNGSESIEASEVISTLPLSLFIGFMEPAAPQEIIEVAKSMKFRHLKLVCLFLDKQSVNNAATVYFPDRQYLFTRVYEPRNRSRLMAPEGKTSLVVEVPYSFGDHIESMPEEDLVAHVRDHLSKAGFFREQEVLDTTVKTLPFAYPILEKGFDQKVAAVSAYFNRFHNLHHSGRSGKFVYSWTHNMMQYGKDIINQIAQEHLQSTGQAAYKEGKN